MTVTQAHDVMGQTNYIRQTRRDLLTGSILAMTNTSCLNLAAGTPVLGNIHPSSPIQHGVSGFLSNDPDELRKDAEILLHDRALAVKMGREARKAVTERFSISTFREAFLRSIETARRKHENFVVNQSGSRSLSASLLPDVH